MGSFYGNVIYFEIMFRFRVAVLLMLLLLTQWNIHLLSMASSDKSKYIGSFWWQIQRSTTLVWQSVEYSSFNLSSESTKYTLSVSGFSGDTVDAFNSGNYANGRAFTTSDSDNDACPCNCASERAGSGWWYGYCSSSYLSGVQTNSLWFDIQGQEMYVVASRMLIRLVH